MLVGHPLGDKVEAARYESGGWVQPLSPHVCSASPGLRRRNPTSSLGPLEASPASLDLEVSYACSHPKGS